VKDRGGYKTANGQESINLKSGSRILFKARTNQGGRGYSDEVDTMPARTVAVELANVGDWPRTDGVENTVISAQQWDACQQDDSVLQDGFVLVVDVSPERHTTIAAVGVNQDGRYHVEVHEHRPGTSWVAKRLAQMVERGDPAGVYCDGLGPAASLIKECAEEDVTLEPLATQDHARACGVLVDAVEADRLRHLGSQELRDAVLGAAQRPLGDAWAWSRKNSSVNIAPLVAVTLGVGAVDMVGQGVFVY